MADQARPVLDRIFSLEGKVALVTGASSGIGRGLAVGLAEAGATVGVHGRNEAEIAHTCRMIEDLGGTALPLQADLVDTAACAPLIETVHAELGGLDILFNNAASNRRKPITEVTEDDYDFVLNVNLKSVYFLSQAAYPLMRDAGGGKIIHIGSINNHFGLDTVSIYGAAKGGVGQLTKAMAVEWARDNVQVNCIVPGFIRTPLTEGIWSDDTKSPWFRRRIPMRRPGNPDDLVGLGIFLASHASDYITGQNFIIDGGFMAGGSWLRDDNPENW
jgi:gluconate 5-dehydrogenase